MYAQIMIYGAIFVGALSLGWFGCYFSMLYLDKTFKDSKED